MTIEHNDPPKKTYVHLGYEFEMNSEGQLLTMKKITSHHESVAGRFWIGAEEAHQVDIIFAQVEWEIRDALEARQILQEQLDPTEVDD